MARYFFHLRKDYDATDEEGQELDGIGSAIEQATVYAREMAAESVREGHLTLSHFIEVTDEDGTCFCKVTFGETVRIRQ